MKIQAGAGPSSVVLLQNRLMPSTIPVLITLQFKETKTKETGTLKIKITNCKQVLYTATFCKPVSSLVNS